MPQGDYDDSYVVKVFLFQSINSYAPIFITAYLDTDVNVLMTMVISSALVLQVSDTFLVFVLPIIKFRAKLKLWGVDDELQKMFNDRFEDRAWKGTTIAPQMSDEEFEEERLIQLEAEYALEQPPELALIYASKVTVIGFITLFASLAPVVVILSAILNFFTIRIEMKGFIHGFRRGEAIMITDIGIWMRILELLSIVAVTNNCAYLFFATDQLERYVDDRTGQLLLVICVEHAVLIIKAVLQGCVPDMPEYVEDQQRHARTLRLKEEAEAKKLERHAQKLQTHEAAKLKRIGGIAGAAKASAAVDYA